MWGVRFMVQGSEFRVQDSECRVQGSASRMDHISRLSRALTCNLESGPWLMTRILLHVPTALRVIVRDCPCAWRSPHLLHKPYTLNPTT